MCVCWSRAAGIHMYVFWSRLGEYICVYSENFRGDAHMYTKICVSGILDPPWWNTVCVFWIRRGGIHIRVFWFRRCGIHVRVFRKCCNATRRTEHRRRVEPLVSRIARSLRSERAFSKTRVLGTRWFRSVPNGCVPGIARSQIAAFLAFLRFVCVSSAPTPTTAFPMRFQDTAMKSMCHRLD